MAACCSPIAPTINDHPSLSFCRGLASSPHSPVCWGSATCPHWETGTDVALGTPSQPGSRAPLSCSGRHRGREDAFALLIGLALCRLSGVCRPCGLGEMRETANHNAAWTGLQKEHLGAWDRAPEDPGFSSRISRWSERETEEKGHRTPCVMRGASKLPLERHACIKGCTPFSCVYAKALFRIFTKNAAQECSVS